jgi:putative MFS transporter
MAVAASRFGSAFATFLLPIAVQDLGIHVALGVCVAVLLIGGVVCHLFAPETSKEQLSAVTTHTHGALSPEACAVPPVGRKIG